MVMNVLDRAISVFSPAWGVSRVKARQILASYDAVNNGNHRKMRRASNSPNQDVEAAKGSVMQQARHLDQNHDLARGILNVLVNKSIGAQGIMVEPQPKNLDGSINVEIANRLADDYKEWSKRPEVTRKHDRASAERLLARHCFRDGDVFQQFIEGTGRAIQHQTETPFSIELIEPELVPGDYSDDYKSIYQGVKLNAWRRPVSFFKYKRNPKESFFVDPRDLKEVKAEFIAHYALRDYIGQVRGMSTFASIITRLEDIKDLEESERVAARLAAAWAGYVKKGTPDQYNAADTDREFQISPGTIFDNLSAGEEIGTLQSNRPNALVDDFRNSQLKAAASGSQAGYSNVSNNYQGSYSSQRQELIDAEGAYAVLTNEFVCAITQPTYERWAGWRINEIDLPLEIDRATLTHAIYRGPQTPWIDPLKAASANKILCQNDMRLLADTWREQGKNPNEMMAGLKREAAFLRELNEMRGIENAT